MAENIRILKRVSASCNLLPGDLLKNTIEEVGFSSLEAVYEDFDGAGPKGPTVEFSTGAYEKLSVTMKLLGNQSQLLTVFDRPAIWTFNGVVEDEISGDKIGWHLHYNGKLAKYEPDGKSRKTLHTHSLALKGIMRAEQIENGTELLMWDYVSGVFRIHGTDINEQERQILGG
ncbi:phage major tail tube protein [Pseudovibrio denitrificans]|uniref:phage major tail tube protein n=1 Tax=Pseudovibrio denitrificans TaxID=258256 RepID=UPI0039BF3AB5